MYSRNSFGSYYPIESIIHKLNPVVKLINFIIVIILSILTNSIYINGFVFILVFIMELLSYVPFNYYFNTFWSLRYVYILIAFICAYFDLNLQTCIVYILKLVSIVEYISLLAYTTSPSESAYGIEKFLSFFNFLCLPISRFAFKINLLLRRYPMSLNIKYKTYKAIASRGMDYYNSNLLGKFVIYIKSRSHIKKIIKEKNKEVFFNQELRMFDLKKYRTNYRTNKVGFYDIFFLLFHISLVLLHLKERGIL